nr:ABC transporter permease [Chloroflexota bacterium]
KQMILPACAIAVGLMAIVMRMTRTTMLEVLNQDYIRTARAKGLRDRIVVYRHALRNALIPVITVIGFQLGALLGGSAIMEVVFGLNGLGNTLLQAIFNRDYPLVQVAALFLATVFVLINLTVDLLYAYLDPRIRQG